MCADIGPVRPVVRPRAANDAPTGEALGRVVLWDMDISETLVVLQDQIEGLTLGILNVRTDELPQRLQRHTIGVPSRWTRLLRMIA